MRGDWKDEAMRFEGIDKTAQKQAEDVMSSKKLTVDQARKKTAVYEVTGAGFQGAIDVTDTRIFWVVGTFDEIKAITQLFGAAMKLLDWPNVQPDHPDIDYTLPQDADALRSKLIRFATLYTDALEQADQAEAKVSILERRLKSAKKVVDMMNVASNSPFQCFIAAEEHRRNFSKEPDNG